MGIRSTSPTKKVYPLNPSTNLPSYGAVHHGPISKQPPTNPPMQVYSASSSLHSISASSAAPSMATSSYGDLPSTHLRLETLREVRKTRQCRIVGIVLVTICVINVIVIDVLWVLSGGFMRTAKCEP